MMEAKKDIVGRFARNEKDTGSSEVQIAVLTARIRHLTEHLKQCRNDHSARRGLLKMVGQRSSLLKYLSRTQRQRYLSTIAALELRH